MVKKTYFLVQQFTGRKSVARRTAVLWQYGIFSNVICRVFDVRRYNVILAHKSFCKNKQLHDTVKRIGERLFSNGEYKGEIWMNLMSFLQFLVS